MLLLKEQNKHITVLLLPVAVLNGATESDHLSRRSGSASFKVPGFSSFLRSYSKFTPPSDSFADNEKRSTSRYRSVNLCARVPMAIEHKGSETQSDAIIVLKERLSKFETVAGRLHGLSYQPKANDIAIATTPKAGTTWVQQICHQIRCALVAPQKSMDFEEISEVVPWIELAHDLGQNLEDEQLPCATIENLPRFFKTHCWYNHCPRFPKTIVVLRDPCDVLISFYNFFEGWFFESGTIDIETFADEFWLARGIPDDSRTQNASYFVHLTSWYEHRHGDESSKILLVFFEDLQDDLEKQIRRIARFVSNDENNFDVEDVIQQATSYSSFTFMKQNENKFDEKLTKTGRNEVCGLPKDAGMKKTKIATGKAGSGHSLPESVREKIQIKWTEVVYPVTECRDYGELRSKHRAECAR